MRPHNYSTPPEPRCTLKELCTIRSSSGTYGPQATEIISRVFLADLYSATNPAILRQLKITHVLSVMPGEVDLPPWDPSRHLQLSVLDMPFEEILPHLKTAVRWIIKALESSPDTRVIVHCFQGISRSSTVVAAYLIAAHGFSVSRALDHIQFRRPFAMPNFGFISQLKEFADSVK